MAALRRASTSESGSRDPAAARTTAALRLVPSSSRQCGLDETPVQGLDEQRVRSERGRDTGAEVARGRRGEGQVVPDVVAAAEQQRYEHGVAPSDAVECVRQQGLVQFDVAEPDVEAGPQLPHPVQELQDGAQGLRVPAAVRDGDQGGGGSADAVHGPAGSVRGDEAELGSELGGDAGQELRRAVEGQGVTGVFRS